MTAIRVSDKATEGSDIFGLISSKSKVKNADDDTVFEITGVADVLHSLLILRIILEHIIQIALH